MCLPPRDTSLQQVQDSAGTHGASQRPLSVPSPPPKFLRQNTGGEGSEKSQSESSHTISSPGSARRPAPAHCRRTHGPRRVPRRALSAVASKVPPGGLSSVNLPCSGSRFQQQQWLSPSSSVPRALCSPLGRLPSRRWPWSPPAGASPSWLPVSAVPMRAMSMSASCAAGPTRRPGSFPPCSD